MIWQNVFYNNIAAYISFINEELEAEFPLEPLSNHIKVLGGYAFKSAEYIDEGIPVIRISDFHDERIDISGVRYFRENKVFDRFQLFAGDIIIAMTGGTIGKLAIVQEGLGKLYLNQRVGKFQVLNKEEFEPEYVYWLARGIQDKVKNLGYGGAQPNVSNGQIEALEFVFPGKKIQLRIIEFLNDLRANKLEPKTYFNAFVEDKILQFQNVGVNIFTVLEECSKQQSYFQLLRQTVLQEAIQGKLTKQDPADEPATELLKRKKREKDKLVKEGKSKKEKELPSIGEDEIPFALPEGWVWCRLSEVGILKRGKSKHRPRNDRKLFDSGSYPFIQTGEVSQAKKQNGCITLINGYYNEFGLKQSEVHKKGTLCITIAANIAEYGFLTFDACVPDSIVCFNSNDVNLSKYVSYFIDISKDMLEQFAPSTAQKNINLEILNELKFPLPPLSEQQRIVVKVQQLQQQIQKLETQVQQSQAHAQQLLQSVLMAAFSEKGKVYEMKEQDEMSLVAEE